MRKRGQVVIFIIIALVLIIGVATTIYILTSGDTLKEEEKLTDHATVVKQFVSSCLDTYTDQAIIYTAMRGGYTSLPEEVFVTEYSTLPYYYDDGITYDTITKEEWETYFPDEEYRRTCEQWPEGANVLP